MSSVTFHAIDDSEELSGAERMHCAHLAERAALGAAMVTETIPWPDDWIRSAALVPYEPDWRFIGHMLCNNEQAALAMPDGSTQPAFGVVMNTAIVLGGDVLAFAARLHATCELHCFVDGANRAWLADIIDRGLATKMFRETLGGHDLGWRQVQRLLRESDVGAVVCSFTVTDTFPNKHVADVDPDVWEDMDDDDRFHHCVAVLRSKDGLELSPETLTTPPFDKGLTLFDYEAAWTAERDQKGGR